MGAGLTATELFPRQAFRDRVRVMLETGNRKGGPAGMMVNLWHWPMIVLRGAKLAVQIEEDLRQKRLPVLKLAGPSFATLVDRPGAGSKCNWLICRSYDQLFLSNTSR